MVVQIKSILHAIWLINKGLKTIICENVVEAFKNYTPATTTFA